SQMGRARPGPEIRAAQIDLERNGRILRRHFDEQIADGNLEGKRVAEHLRIMIFLYQFDGTSRRQRMKLLQEVHCERRFDGSLFAHVITAANSSARYRSIPSASPEFAWARRRGV